MSQGVQLVCLGTGSTDLEVGGPELLDSWVQGFRVLGFLVAAFASGVSRCLRLMCVVCAFPNPTLPWELVCAGSRLRSEDQAHHLFS
jgi:hypothetical protein